MQAVKIQ